MKLFVSWSGDLSHKIAISLRDWLPKVLPYVEPWVSSKDIPKGARWGAVLAQQLEGSHSGVVCLVRENITEPWLNFEAGALSKAVDEARVRPILFGFGVNELKGPLSQFQATLFSKEELLKFAKDINAETTLAISAHALTANFEENWPQFEKELLSLLEGAAPVGRETATSIDQERARTESGLAKFIRDSVAKPGRMSREETSWGPTFRALRARRNEVWTVMAVGRRIVDSRSVASNHREADGCRILNVDESYVQIELLGSQTRVTIPLGDIVISYDDEKHRPKMELRSKQ